MPRKRRGARKRNSAWAGTVVETGCDDEFVEAGGNDEFVGAGCDDAFASVR